MCEGFGKSVLLFGDNETFSDILNKIILIIKQTSLNILRNNFNQTINALIKLSQIEKFALFIMDKTNEYWIPQNNNGNRNNANIIIKASIIGGLLNLSFETTDIMNLFNGLTTENISNNLQLQQIKILIHHLMNFDWL